MSRLLYAAPLLTNLNKMQTKKLLTVQASALKIALGIPRHTPNLVLAESGQKPINITIVERAAKYFYKTTCMPRDHPAKLTLTEDHRPKWETTQQPQLKALIGKLENTIDLKISGRTPSSTLGTPLPTWKLPPVEVDLDLTKFNKETDGPKMKVEFDMKRTTTYQDHTIIYTDRSHDPRNRTRYPCSQ